MRLATGYLGCVLVLVSQGICAPALDGEDSSERRSPGFGQRGQLLGRGNSASDTREVQEVRIIERTITESYPRITEAPRLLRKLGSTKWDAVHEKIQGVKRDGSSCPVDYQLCPQSMDGGCCPNDRVCGTSSCFPPTDAPVTACGTVGYSACGLNLGGGCCPTNYACLTNGCSPSAGVPNTETCGINSFLCPASLNYGCCLKGMACGINQCYSTAVELETYIFTLFSTDHGSTVPYTTQLVVSITPTIPSAGTAPVTTTGVSPKPSGSLLAEAKLPAESVGGGGLTKSQLGGLIAGVVILFIIVMVLAFFIIFRLNKVKQAIENSKSYKSYRSASNSGYSHSRGKPSNGPTIPTVIGDSQILSPEAAKKEGHPSEPSPIHVTHEMDVPVQSPRLHPDTPLSPPYHTYGPGYNAVATAEPPSPPYRHSPSDFPDMVPQTPAGAAPVPDFHDRDAPLGPDLRDQNLRFGHYGPAPPATSAPSIRSQRPSAHERQWSGDTDISRVSQEAPRSAPAPSEPGTSTVASSEWSFNRPINGFKWMLKPKKDSPPAGMI